MPSEPAYTWDVFISYAHQDFAWVKQNLYEPLKGCRTREHRAPRVFFDADKIDGGTNWAFSLADAIQKSQQVIPVYSEAFFQSDMCLFELSQAFDRDPIGRRKTMLPLLIEPQSRDSIPAPTRLIQFIDCTSDDWFSRLLQQLGLRHLGRIHTLRFVTPVVQATVSQTLPEVQVALEYNGAPVRDEVETVHVFAENAPLLGTCSARTHDGAAVFQDLFFESESAATRLVATSPSCPAAYSESFSVAAAAPIQTKRETPSIPLEGEIAFFRGADALAVTLPDAVEVFDFEARRLGRMELTGAGIRFSRRLQQAMVCADWSGKFSCARADGTSQSWQVPAQAGFCIPGDVAGPGPGSICAGMWDGRVLRLQPGGECEPWFVHKGGVQTLAVDGDEVFLCDFESTLARYVQGRLADRFPVERLVRMLKLDASTVVLAGQRKLFQLSRPGLVLSDFPLQIEVSAAYADSQWPIAIGPDGRGVVFDHNLTIQRVFHARPGAVPVSVDQSTSYCVLRNPDGTSSLLAGNRVILHHTAGALAVSENASHFAVGEPAAIRILTREEMVEVAKGSHA